MRIVQILSKIARLEPLLALPSLASFEPPFEGHFESEVRDSETVEGARGLFPPGADEPLVNATTSEDGLVRWNIPDPNLLTADYRAALAALGGGKEAGRGSGLNAALDGDEFDRRIATLDNAWVLLHRVADRVADFDQAVSITSDLLRMAADWREARDKAFTARNESLLARAEDALEARSKKIGAEVRQMIADLRLPGLSTITLVAEPLGPSLTLGLDGRDHGLSVLGYGLDWTPFESVLADAPAPIKPMGEGKYAVRPSKLNEAALGALRMARIGERSVRLVQQLPPKVYKEVNSILNELGGTWHTGRQEHVFEDDVSERLRQMLASGQMFTRKDFEFFPTPPKLVQQLIRSVSIQPGMKCMEPHAGGGAIAMAMAEVVGRENVTCFELMPENVRDLARMGFNIAAPVDFLSVKPKACMDVIILNPPFSGGRDMAHIRHAFKFLAPGGRLAAISSTSWKSKDAKACTAFRDWLDELGAEVKEIPAGAFKASGTDVATLQINIRAPGARSAVAVATKRSEPTCDLALEQACLF